MVVSPDPTAVMSDVAGPAEPVIDLLDALAASIVRIASSATLDDLAVATSREAAVLGAAHGTAVVLWDDADRPVAAAVDGQRWGFPDVMDRAIRTADPETARGEPVLRLTGFHGTLARSVLGAIRLAAPSGDRGILVLLAVGRDASPPLVPVRRAVLTAFAAAVGGIAEQMAGNVAEHSMHADPEFGTLVHDAWWERRRIARELHDGLIQSLFGTGLAIRAQASQTDTSAESRATMLRWVDRIDLVIEEARGYVDELEQADDAVTDLGAGLDAIAEVAVAAGVDVSTEVSAVEHIRPSAEVRREILRVAREAVSNAVRHSSARRIAVRVDMDPGPGMAELTVEDDGTGFDPGGGLPAGHGLRNMLTRAAALGGALDVVSRPGAGTKIRLQVPLSARPPRDREDI